MSPILSTITSGSLIRGNSSIVSDNLALHYNFGIPECYSGSGTSVNNLARLNPVNTGSAFPGIINQATFTSTPPAYLNFDGINDWIGVTAPTNSFETNNAVSVEVWMYPQSITGQFVVARGGANSFDLLHNFLSLGNISYRVRDVANSTYRQVSRNISLNNWSHVVGTFSANLISIYVNNVASSLVIPTSTIGGSDASPYGLRIGTYLPQALSFNYNGRISEVRIYRKELSAIEVAKNYNATKFKYGL
jgi:hypothetical protein